MAAPRAGFSLDLRGEVRVLTQFPVTAGTSHAEILQCPPESGEFVAFEVGHADESIGHVDGVGYGNRLENGFVDLDVDRAVSSQAVSDHEGGAYNRGRKPVLVGGGQVRNRLCPAADIEGVGIG